MFAQRAKNTSHGLLYTVSVYFPSSIVIVSLEIQLAVSGNQFNWVGPNLNQLKVVCAHNVLSAQATQYGMII